MTEELISEDARPIVLSIDRAVFAGVFMSAVLAVRSESGVTTIVRWFKGPDEVARAERLARALGCLVVV